MVEEANKPFRENSSKLSLRLHQRPRLVMEIEFHEELLH